MAERVMMSMLLAGALACSGSRSGAGGSGAGRGGEAAVTTRSINEVLAAHSDSLMALPGVIGTAIGLCDGERCIKVLLSDSNPANKSRIPARLEGYRVVAEVTGPIKPRKA